MLWQGGYQSYEGKYLQLEDARVFDLPEVLPVIAVAREVMAELPNPVNFEAAVASITGDQVREQFACGPDVSRHLEVAQPFADAGFDHLVMMNAGPDPDGFMDFFARELAEPLRKLTPSSLLLMPNERR